MITDKNKIVEPNGEIKKTEKYDPFCPQRLKEGAADNIYSSFIKFNPTVIEPLPEFIDTTAPPQLKASIKGIASYKKFALKHRVGYWNSPYGPFQFPRP